MAQPAGVKGPTPRPKAAGPSGAAGPTPRPKAGGGGAAAKSGGARSGRKGGGGFNPAKIAAQQIKLSEQPVQQQIAAERAANLARAQAQMGFAKAAAAIMEQAAPNVQQGYTNAANADAGYSKGLGDIVQGNLDHNAQSSNSFLQNMGTPQAGLQQAPAVGQLAYGTGGYIPATALQREGAAWGAAAQLAPGNLLGRGQQDAAAALANDPQLAALQTELAKIAATEPEVYRQIVNTYEQRVYQQQQLRQSQQRIGISEQGVQLRAQEIQAQNAYRQTSLQMQQERITLSSRKDAAAVALAVEKGHRPSASLSKVYGYVVDANGDAVLNHGHKIPVKTSKSKSTSGLPPWGASKRNPNGAGPGGAGSATGAAIAKNAHQYIGTPYVWGGWKPSGFDCSGLAYFLYGEHGIQIPRTTYDQWGAGRKVGRGRFQPGDLIFYKGSDSIVRNGKVLPGHVGIYIGHGKIIDAYGTGYGVRVDPVFSPYMGGYMGARRYG